MREQASRGVTQATCVHGGCGTSMPRAVAIDPWGTMVQRHRTHRPAGSGTAVAPAAAGPHCSWHVRPTTAWGDRHEPHRNRRL